MNFKELPAHQIWHRIQRKTARSDSVRTNGFVLAPSGGLVGRFDLANEPQLIWVTARRQRCTNRFFAGKCAVAIGIACSSVC